MHHVSQYTGWIICQNYEQDRCLVQPFGSRSWRSNILLRTNTIHKFPDFLNERILCTCSWALRFGLTIELQSWVCRVDQGNFWKFPKVGEIARDTKYLENWIRATNCSISVGRSTLGSKFLRFALHGRLKASLVQNSEARGRNISSLLSVSTLSSWTRGRIPS